jgi:hypothetical protein
VRKILGGVKPGGGGASKNRGQGVLQNFTIFYKIKKV